MEVGSGNRDGIVDRLGENEVQHGARDERRGEVGWEVVVEEELTIHEVEWQIMERPCADKESSGIEQAAPDDWERTI